MQTHKQCIGHIQHVSRYCSIPTCNLANYTQPIDVIIYVCYQSQIWSHLCNANIAYLLYAYSNSMSITNIACKHVTRFNRKFGYEADSELIIVYY